MAERNELSAKLVFNNGQQIIGSSHFRLIWGYKTGLEHQPEGERMLLVPTDRDAEEVLKLYADRVGFNTTQDVPFGEEDETITAIRYSGDPHALVEFLNSNGRDFAGIAGAGVPSLKDLENKLKK